MAQIRLTSISTHLKDNKLTKGKRRTIKKKRRRRKLETIGIKPLEVWERGTKPTILSYDP